MENLEEKINREVEDQKDALGKMAVTFLLLAGAFVLIAKLPGLIRAAVKFVHGGGADTLVKQIVKDGGHLNLEPGKEEVCTKCGEDWPHCNCSPDVLT